MSALAIEYAQILLDTMPEYFGLTGNALKKSREALIKEAEQIKSGCESHFLRSAVKLASNGEIIPLMRLCVAVCAKQQTKMTRGTR
jgi:hypothetical protein